MLKEHERTSTSKFYVLGPDLCFLLLPILVWETLLDCDDHLDDVSWSLLGIQAYIDWRDKPVLTTITTTAYSVKQVNNTSEADFS